MDSVCGWRLDGVVVNRAGVLCVQPFWTEVTLHTCGEAMRRLNNDHLFDFAESLTGPPSGGWIQRWVLGIGIAVSVAVFGLVSAIASSTWVLNVRLRGAPRPFTDGLLTRVDGEPAVAAGLFFVALGAFIHVQWFWGTDDRLESFYGWFELGKIISVLAMIAAIGWGVHASLF